MATVRFAAGSADGPHATVWRLWANRKGDVFLAARALAGKFKASLHVSGLWRFAATKENAASQKSLVGYGRDRAIHKWRRPQEFAPGLTKAMEIWVAGVDVDSPPTPKSSKGNVRWLEAPAKDQFGVFEVMLSRLDYQGDEWPGIDSMATEEVYRARLTSGEQLFVTWRVVEARPEFWVNRAKSVSEQLPPPGEDGLLDNPSDMSRITIGGEANGIGIILDVSASAVAKERLRYQGELWTPDRELKADRS